MSHLGTDPRLPQNPPAGYVQLLVTRLYDLLRGILQQIDRMERGYLFESRSLSSDATLTVGDSIIIATAPTVNVTLTLPLASSCINKRFTIKKADSTVYYIILDAQGSDLIDGGATLSMTSPLESVDVVSDGANWWII